MRLGSRPLVLALLAASLLAGCGAPDPATLPGVVPQQDDEGRYAIAMGAHQFLPAEVKVPKGSTVVWSNNSTADHDINGYVGDPIEDPEARADWFAPFVVKPGMEFAHAFPDRGTWTVWCHTHHEEGMKGVIRVY